MTIYRYRITVERPGKKTRYVIFSPTRYDSRYIEETMGLLMPGIIGHTVIESRHTALPGRLFGELIIEEEPIKDFKGGDDERNN